MPKLRLPFLILFFLAALAVVVHWFNTAARFQSGLVTADPHSYLSYARNLERGRFYIDDPLTPLTAKHLDLTNAAPGKLVQGPIWNTSVRPDGKTCYTVAIGYPLFQAGMLRLGGLRLALHANIILWGFVVLFAFLLVFEGAGRDLGAAAAAATGAAVLPFFDPHLVANIFQCWREPLFIACLFGAGWLLLRFWRKPGLIGPCLMALLLGYACSTKEGNVFYLPLFGVMFLVGMARHMTGPTTATDAPAQRRRLSIAKGLVILVLAAVCGLVGLGPILFHNHMAGGNALVSPQTVRATADLAGGSDGFNLMNPFTMAHWYWFHYSYKLPRFAPLWMGIAFIGAAWLGLRQWMRRKDEGVRLVVLALSAALLALMTLLYWKWGLIETELLGREAFDMVKGRAHARADATAAGTWAISAAVLGAFLLLHLRSALLAWIAGFVASHFALYLLWANMDPRHMIVVSTLYFLCAGVGAYAVCDLIAARFGVRPKWRPAAALPGLLALFVAVVAWQPGQSWSWKNEQGWHPPRIVGAGIGGEGVFRPRHGEALAAWFAERGIEDNAVVFGHRRLSEIVNLYTPHHCLRLHELKRLAGEGTTVHDLIGELLEAGHPLYYLDSRDLDPKILEWSDGLDKVDRELLQWSYDLSEVAAIDRDDFSLTYHHRLRDFEKKRIPLYAVAPRDTDGQRRLVQMPAEGAAFLAMDPRSAGTNALYSLGGHRVPIRDPYFLHRPVAHLDLPAPGGKVALTAGPDVPTLDNAELLGWDDRIVQDPVITRSQFAERPTRVNERGYVDLRGGPDPFEVPVRWRGNAFTCLGLNITVMNAVDTRIKAEPEDLTNAWVVLRDPWRHEFRRHAMEKNFFFPIHRIGEGDFATNALFTVGMAGTNYFPRLHKLTSELAYTEFTVPTDDVTSMVFLYGRLAASDPGPEPSRWALHVNSNRVAEGRCHPNPLRSANAFRHLLKVEPGVPTHIRFAGAGLIQRDVVPVRTRLEIPAAGDRPALFPEAFHAPENAGAGPPFMWTKGRFRLPVPVIPGARKYTLTIEGFDGHPDYPVRPLRLRLLGQEKTVRLDPSPTFRYFTFEDVVVDRPGSHDLEFEIETWRPAERNNDPKDPRELGFHLRRLVWEPAWR